MSTLPITRRAQIRMLHASPSRPVVLSRGMLPGSCPKCTHSLPLVEPPPQECPACGIIFDRFRSRKLQDEGPEKSRTSPLPMSTVVGVSLLVCAILGAIRVLMGGLQPVVSVRSFFFAEVPHIWDRWCMECVPTPTQIGTPSSDSSPSFRSAQWALCSVSLQSNCSERPLTQ